MTKPEDNKQTMTTEELKQDLLLKVDSIISELAVNATGTKYITITKWYEEVRSELVNLILSKLAERDAKLKEVIDTMVSDAQSLIHILHGTNLSEKEREKIKNFIKEYMIKEPIKKYLS